MQAVHDGLYERALKNLEEKTFTATTYEEFLDIAENKPGFIKAMWCGDSACEDKLKDATGGVKSRCIPFKEEHLSDVCVCCGKRQSTWSTGADSTDFSALRSAISNRHTCFTRF